MTTTPSTASQAPAVSIDTSEFLKLMIVWSDTAPGQEALEAFNAVVAHIDAKLAQAVAAETARCQEIADARQRGWDSQWDEEMAKARVQIVEQEREKAFDNHPELLQLREQNKFMLDERDSLIDRATAAEAKLEAIRQKLSGYVAATLYDEHGNDFYVDDFAAILLPQPKADESGLPG